MNRAFALTIGLLAALAPAVAGAQTNIDQGKSASQIFSNACAECHKSVAALRKGKSAAAIAEFLREHYTTGPQQAASLAAYVVGGRDSVASPTPGQRPAAERLEHGQKPPKPEEGATANAKPRRPAEEPRDEASPGGSFMNPIARPEPQRPTTATRNRRKDKDKDKDQASPAPEPAQEPAAIARVPAAPATEPTRPEPMTPEAPPPAAAPTPPPTAAAPMVTPSGESGEPVPRDNVPD